MIYPNGQILFRMYEDGEELPGVVKVSMPEIKYKTVTTQGAGIMGSANIPLAGMIDPMTVSMEFSSHDAMTRLGRNKWHDVSLYEASQYFDAVNRTEELRSVRFDLSIRPTSTGMGDVQAFAGRNAKAEFSVCRYAVYVNGEEEICIDQFNCIHRIHGEDAAADVRKALGMV